MPLPDIKPHKGGSLLALAVAAAITLTAAVYLVTNQKREQARRQLLLDQITALMPEAVFKATEIHQAETLDLTLSALVTINKVYPVTRGGQPAAVIQAVTTQGYSGDIQLLAAMDSTPKLIGVAILSHSETPGLGDKIEASRSDWLTQFSDLNIDSIPANAWRVKKDGGDFDQITGATITPRAIVNAVASIAEWYKQRETP